MENNYQIAECKKRDPRFFNFAIKEKILKILLNSPYINLFSLQLNIIIGKSNEKKKLQQYKVA